MNIQKLNIEHDEHQMMFTAEMDNRKKAYVKYINPSPYVLDFTETFVPEESRHNGIASQLVQHAVDYAATNGYHVIPSCPFVRSFFKEHPEMKELIEKESTEK